ncbi:MAG: AEC family transporter [Alkalispirochaeta sp.]
MDVTATDPNTVFLSAVLVMALGYGLRKIGLVTREHGALLAKLVINVTLPALILETLPGVELSVSLLFLPLLALGHSAVAFVAATVLFRRRPPAERGLMTMCSMGFNNGLFAFPIVMGIWGTEAVRMLAIYDVGNGLTVLGINYVVAGWFGGLAAAGAAQGSAGVAATLGLREALRRIGRTLITSVPMVVFLGALVLNLTGWRLPAPVERGISTVAAANGALALLVLGIFQSLRVRRSDLPIIVRVLGLRYAVGALLAVSSIVLLGATPLYRQVLAIVFILPIGMTSIPFSVEFGLDTRLATTMVNLSIMVSFAIMWGVVAMTG